MLIFPLRILHNGDVIMGSFDGAETSELVGLYLISKVSKIIDNARLGLYRDDGLALITNCNGQKLDRIRKKLHQTFKDKGLKITVELCDENVDFLDNSLNVSVKSNRPYKKPNDAPLYINKMSNLPKSIINNIPDDSATYQVTKDLYLIQNTHTSLLSNTAVLPKGCNTRNTQHPETRQGRKEMLHGLTHLLAQMRKRELGRSSLTSWTNISQSIITSTRSSTETR